MNLPPHGANPAHLYEASGLGMPGTVIDFSVNTNPSGPPGWLREQWMSFYETVEEYPDPSGEKAGAAIARRFSLSPDQVMLGNGAAEIIHFIARHAAGQKAVIVTPAFSEYEEACLAYGCTIDYVPVSVEHWKLPVQQLAEKAKEAAVLFICTPNNPSGRAFQRAELLALFRATRGLPALIVIDEAFYDFAEEPSLASAVKEFPHVAVLHSLTKMYAVAGLRIGYIAAAEPVIQALAPFRPHWNVNALALQIAEKTAVDTAYAPETRAWVNEEKQRMLARIRLEGFTVLPSDANFYLLRDPELDNQQPLLHFLMKNGMVLRHTENFRGLDGRWLRCAVKKEHDNNQLLAWLKEWKSR